MLLPHAISLKLTVLFQVIEKTILLVLVHIISLVSSNSLAKYFFRPWLPCCHILMLPCCENILKILLFRGMKNFTLMGEVSWIGTREGCIVRTYMIWLLDVECTILYMCNNQGHYTYSSLLVVQIFGMVFSFCFRCSFHSLACTKDVRSFSTKSL